MKGSPSTGQIAFQFPLTEEFVFSDFAIAGNEELVAHLQSLDANPRFSMTWVWGLPGRGKTHLLQAVCHSHTGAVAYLPARSIVPEASKMEVLEGIGGYQLVIIDDLDVWIGHREPEAQLMALYTSMLQNCGHLVVSSQYSPKTPCFSLPDFASRARAGEIYEVNPVAEYELPKLLTRWAKRRGLALEPEVVTYWLSRKPRELSSLLKDLDALDNASLSRVRRLTVPFLRDVLNL